MSDLVELFERSVDGFGERVHAVPDDGWHGSTPCTDWDVRTLVNHLVNEARWMAPLLAGKTIDEVGDALDGDLLGDDPKAAWGAAAAEAKAAVAEPGAAERTVHLSFGDTQGSDYIAQVLGDHVIHTWDLARAVGADERLDPELVALVLAGLAPQVEEWRSAGIFGDRVEVADDADAQTRLLALTGRRP